MEPPLSSYWVRFFKNAGFPNDVATRHALIFSNNRIKPDMLPDLDKPSLKEMGITLMGDMIAILRYAKKVVEETTTKKFLVNSEDSPTPAKTVVKPVIKKTVITKTSTKTPTSTKVKLEDPTKVIKTASNSAIKPTIVKKKLPPIIQTSQMYSDYIDPKPSAKTSPLKRKYSSEDEEDSDEKWGHIESEKRLKASSDIEYKVIVPKTTVRSQKILKKAVEQKRTVFHRLGDSMVSSTTTIPESTSNFNPTFTVTGIGKDVHKRTSSVFNRLGNRDTETSDTLYSRNLRNGGVTSQGILKTRTPMHGTKVIVTTKSALKKPIGTMRADEEANKKAVSESVRQLVRTTKSLKFNDGPRNDNFVRKLPTITGKLASERLAVPVKSRLGGSKQVTFNKTPTINHIKRSHQVFSRLGV